MKTRVVLSFLLLLLQVGCYVRTQIEVQSNEIPPGLSAPVLSIVIRQGVSLPPHQMAELEQDAVQAFRSHGIECLTLKEATGVSDPDRALERLWRADNRALLELAVTSWGSKTVTLIVPTTPTVASLDTERDSAIFRPGSIEDSQRPGPKTSYKEVAITGTLTDLQRNRIFWYGEASARPALIGRSFLYHRFNRGLSFRELANRCFGKLGKRLARAWPKD